jgi:predicted metal-dependent enzyme (double-stranded beta helix superfamily)
MNTENQFIDAIHTAMTSTYPQGAVEDILHQALAAWSGPPPWMGPPNAGNFGLLHAGEDVTIMNIVWPPHMITEPHNHNMWATIGLYTGRENNVLWQRDGDTIKEAGVRSVGAGDILSLPEDAIHSVFNPLAKHTGAIHVYGGDFMNTPKSEWESEFHREGVRDMDAIRKAFQTDGA